MLEGDEAAARRGRKLDGHQRPFAFLGAGAAKAEHQQSRAVDLDEFAMRLSVPVSASIDDQKAATNPRVDIAANDLAFRCSEEET